MGKLETSKRYTHEKYGIVSLEHVIPTCSGTYSEICVVSDAENELHLVFDWDLTEVEE